MSGPEWIPEPTDDRFEPRPLSPDPASFQAEAQVLEPARPEPLGPTIEDEVTADEAETDEAEIDEVAPKRPSFKFQIPKFPGLRLPSLGRERHEMILDPPSTAPSPEEEPLPPRPVPARFSFLSLKRETRVGIAALLSFVVIVGALVVKKGSSGKVVALNIPTTSSEVNAPVDPEAKSDADEKEPEEKQPQAKEPEAKAAPETSPPIAPEPETKVAPPPGAPIGTRPLDPKLADEIKPSEPSPTALEPLEAGIDPKAPADPSAQDPLELPGDVPESEPAIPTSPEMPVAPIPTVEEPPAVPEPAPEASPSLSPQPSMLSPDNPLASGGKPPVLPEEPAPEPSMIGPDSLSNSKDNLPSMAPEPAVPALPEPSGKSAPIESPMPMIPEEPAPPKVTIAPEPAAPPQAAPVPEPAAPPKVTLAPEPLAPPQAAPVPEPVAPPKAEATLPVLAEQAPRLDPVPNPGPASPAPEPAGAEASKKGAGWVVIPSGGKRIPTAAARDLESPTIADGPRLREEVAVSDQIEPVLHRVQPGENFWTISRDYYRSGRYYKALHAANDRQVPKIDELYVGTVLRIPPPEALDRQLILPAIARSKVEDEPTGSKINLTSRRENSDGSVELSLPTRPRRTRAEPDPEAVDPPQRPTYTVRPHETLRSIARDTLNDSRRDHEIYSLNRDIIDDPTALAPGTVLTLPEDAVPGRRAR